MHVPTATHHFLRLPLSAIAFTLLTLFAVAVTKAQPIQFVFGSSPQAELTPPQVDVVSGPTASRLEQARALAADKNWNEAVATYRELSNDETGRVVALDDGLYIGLRSYCHMQLAQLPAEGLATYRRGVDSLAAQWYREGIADRDEQKLRRIVDEMFCSSWGDDALLALGEMALERADVAAARRWWEQISPLLRDPNGLPTLLALRDLDLSVHWPEIERRWLKRSKPPQWLAYPGTTLELADVRARLILASIRAGEFDRAALEIDVFRRLHPTAVGRLGGQEAPYVPALEQLLSAAREWPTEPLNANWPSFAGSQTRCSSAPQLGPVIGPAWAKPVKLPKMSRTHRVAVARGFNLGGQFGGGLEIDDSPKTVVRESESPLSCYPVVVDNVVVFNDGMQIRAVDLATGQPTITPNGELYREESPEGPGNRMRTDANGAIRYDAVHGVPRSTLNAVEGVIFGRVGRFATTRLDAQHALPGDRLIGIDLDREGLLAFQAKPEDASWSFDGAPVSDGRRLWVAMRHSDVSPHAYVACFDIASSTLIWRTSIGAAETPAAGSGDEITHNLLTLVSDRIYFNTNLGLVAALDAENGEICWLHRYERTTSGFAQGLEGPLHFDRDPSPCLYRDGLLIVAPADTPEVFALDAQIGQQIWITDQLPDALHLLGVVGQNIVISGNRLWALDIRSGTKRFVWPESEHAGIRGMGRGVVAGDEIFWPTRDAIYVMHALTGERTRPPIQLGDISSNGANLAAAHGRLVVSTHDKLTAFGPTRAAPPSNPRPPETALRTGRFSDQSAPE